MTRPSPPIRRRRRLLGLASCFPTRYLILFLLPHTFWSFLATEHWISWWTTTSTTTAHQHPSTSNDNYFIGHLHLLNEEGVGNKPHHHSPVNHNSSSITTFSKLENDKVDKPEICWLLSFPNSGTSYTMTLVAQASKQATASNYGVEVTDAKYPSLPVHRHHPEGPYWEGLSGRVGTVRPLPSTYVMTKSHCGSRCIRCGASEFVVSNATAFMRACARTTARLGKARRIEAFMDPARVRRVIHLIRNPFHNIVARFHLEGRNLVRREDAVKDKLPLNATGFATFCHILDRHFAINTTEIPLVGGAKVAQLMQRVPCANEFYKYVQWHNYVGILYGNDSEVADAVATFAANQEKPILTLYYEDYEKKGVDAMAKYILDFLELDVQGQLKAFRPLPTYDDHYTLSNKRAAVELVKSVASPWTWQRIRHYFDGLS